MYMRKGKVTYKYDQRVVSLSPCQRSIDSHQSITTHYHS